MATVYLARLSGVGGFQRFVAIKRLHPHLAREPEFIEMFLDEARLAARIHHPNVVPILEVGASEEGYYLVMEYVEGDTLARLLARSAQTGRAPARPVGLRVIIDMLAGLHAAHELKDDDGKPLGIVHRDVSPQNVLVGVDGSSRLTDFGVARATSKLSTTRTGQLKGKLAYMAPEQARGAKDIDRRADVFAAGVVLWEVLACRRLFKGDGEADTLNKVLNEPIPPVRSASRPSCRRRSRRSSAGRSSAIAPSATRRPRSSPTRSSGPRAWSGRSGRTRTSPRTSRSCSGRRSASSARRCARGWRAASPAGTGSTRRREVDVRHEGRGAGRARVRCRGSGGARTACPGSAAERERAAGRASPACRPSRA